MENALFNLAAGNGIWATLYVFLFLYVLYDSRNREKKYQSTIEENQSIIKELSKKFGIVENIQKDGLILLGENVSDLHGEINVHTIFSTR